MVHLNHIPKNKIRAIFFDVDGTLYNQKRLRKRMMKALIGYYAVRPHKAHEIEWIRQFRKEREKMADDTRQDIERVQYERAATKIGTQPDKVKTIIEQWMFDHPLAYLKDYVYDGVHDFFSLVRSKEIPIGVYSDFRADEKLEAMSLEADKVVCSTDTFIDRLKPEPKGLTYLAEHFHVAPENCLMVGDRDERDGEAARRAGMHYVIIEKSDNSTNTFHQLIDHFSTT